jgi:hypothetical protein
MEPPPRPLSPQMKRKRNSNQTTLPPIESLPTAFATSDAITCYLQLLYDEELELDRETSKCYNAPFSSSLEKLQMASEVSSNFHDTVPFAADSVVWSFFGPGISDAIIGLSASPRTFDISPFIAAGVCIIRREEELELERDKKLRRYYTRRLMLSQQQYANVLEVYGRRYPEDLAHVVLHLQYLGFGDRASALLTEVMTALGYRDVTLKMDPSVEGSRPSVVPMYSGTSIHSPENRNTTDTNHSGTNTSRIRNFTALNKGLTWDVIEWVPLQMRVNDHLEWRTKPEQGQIEAVLTDCIVPNFNKARGGWIHAVKLHSSISGPLDLMLQMLPPPRPSDLVPAGLTHDLNRMVDLEQDFVQALSASNDVGLIFGPVAVEHVKREFVAATRWINGCVPSITLTKDLPQEAGHGRIDTSLDGAEVGRAVALYQAILKAIYSRDPNGNLPYRQIRDLDGSFIDLWRSFEMHKWWGLLILVTGLYFRRMQPYIIYSWSSVVEAVFKSNLLFTLPRDLGLDELEGPEAMAALTPQHVDHPSLRQTFHARKDPKFREQQGQARIIRFGGGDLDLAIHMGKGDPSDPFYRQVLFRHDKRRHTLVDGLSLALSRLTEQHLASQEPPATQEGRVKLLTTIKHEFDKVALDSGMRQALDEELRRQRICDQAQGALLGKHVGEEEDVAEGDDAEEGTGKQRKRRKTEQVHSHPRNNGVLALGEPFSSERRRQLSGLQRDVRIAQLLGQEPEVVWYDGAIATSSTFEYDFLRLPTNHSLQQALNAHGRTAEGIEARKADGRRLAAVNKEWATATRAQKAELWGGWIKAEQYEEMRALLPSLRFDMTHQTFEESQRMATCPSCSEVTFGNGKNTEHRCTIDTAPVKIVKTTFSSYSRILYPHDILGVEAINKELRSLVALDCHLEAAPATDWLSSDDPPFVVAPTALKSVSGVVFWSVNEPKDSNLNRLMAADVALRELCPGLDPLDMAERRGMTIAEGARALYNSNQEKFWIQTFMDRLVTTIEGEVTGCICLKCGDTKLETGKPKRMMMIHAPCTRGGGTKDESSFYWFKPLKLMDLPHSIARVLLYRAVRGGGSGKEAPQRTKGKERKVKRKTFEEWQALLEWLG